MKLYSHPASTTSRPVLLFCAYENIDIEIVTVDLFSGAHLHEDYLSINPNGLVPALDDDGFILTESSAILKYLADKANSPTYPKDLKKRARINEVMDWFNTQFYREFGYHMIYPQVFPGHKRATDEGNQSIVNWGLEGSKKALAVLDGRWHMLAGGGTYLLGNDITIADFLGAEFVAFGDVVRCDLSAYPNVSRWINKMKSLPAWAEVNAAATGFAESLKDQTFVAVA